MDGTDGVATLDGTDGMLTVRTARTVWQIWTALTVISDRPCRPQYLLHTNWNTRPEFYFSEPLLIGHSNLTCFIMRRDGGDGGRKHQ